MTTQEAMDFLDASFTVLDAVRAPGSEYDIQDKMKSAFTTLKNRIKELEAENGKLKLSEVLK